MSRTYRHILKVKVRQFWDKLLQQETWSLWRNLPRDLRVEQDHIGHYHGSYRHKTRWRHESNARERALVRNSLKHGGMYWYWRRKHGDGYWD